MAGGPILPSSIYVGGASGSLSPTFYIPATNTNGGGALEGIAVVSSLTSSTTPYPCVMQFNMPESIPTGVLKLRALAMANATSGTAKYTISDGVTSAGSNIGATTLTSETQVSQTWATADILVENKTTLTASPTANQILTCVASFNSTGGWTLAAQSVWQFSAVWE
jgi:hypothetical protein